MVFIDFLNQSLSLKRLDFENLFWLSVCGLNVKSFKQSFASHRSQSAHLGHILIAQDITHNLQRTHLAKLF